MLLTRKTSLSPFPRKGESRKGSQRQSLHIKETKNHDLLFFFFFVVVLDFLFGFLFFT